jgi:hypothetical protein
MQCLVVKKSFRRFEKREYASGISQARELLWRELDHGKILKMKRGDSVNISERVSHFYVACPKQPGCWPTRQGSYELFIRKVLNKI